MRTAALAAIAIALSLAAVSGNARAGTVTVEQHSGRTVRVFVPAKVASPAPLVVMLHGCTQTAEAFADATQMDAVAEAKGFVVAYPEQSSDTIPTRCFRWYDPAHQARDAGEPKELADAADEIAVAHGVDPERVYVAGLSAGAAMSVILGATYPDRFTAIGVVAGVEYKAATSISEGLSAAQSGGPDPEQQGDLAHMQMGARARAVPTFVVHGTADSVLAKKNGDQVASQWRRTNSLVLGPDAIDPPKSVTGDAGYPFTRFVHQSKANGASVIEYYVVDGLGHAWPGGKDGGSYSDPKGPDASTLLWAFFEGRTRSHPLDVPAAMLPDSPGPSGDAGPPGSNPGAAQGSGDPSAPSGGSGKGDDGGGGCHVGREGREPHLASAFVVLASVALIAGFARRRRIKRAHVPAPARLRARLSRSGR